MKQTVIALSSNDVFICFGIGIILGILYLFFLWQTVSILPQVKHKNFVKFFSTALRLFFLIFSAILFSKNNIGRFFIIMCGVILTRLFLLKLLKPSLKQEITDNEIVYAEDKSTSPNKAKKQKKSSKKPTKKRKK